MNRLKNLLPTGIVSALGVLAFASRALADIPPTPGAVSSGDSGILVGSVVSVALVVIISLLVLRAISKK